MDALDIFALVRRVDSSDDPNVGSNRTPSSSASSLVSTLIPTLLISCAFVAVFLLLRRTEQRQYAPRTYLGSLREQERTPSLPKTLFGWIPTMNKIPDTYVLQHNSIDGYFLLRYLKIATIICLVGCCITWPILFPVNATGHAGNSQLDVLNISNVANGNRYYAHTFIAWIFIGFIYFMVTRESIYYINVRQAYLLSPLYASRISSRTVLFTSVSTDYANEDKIRKMYGKQLKNVWIATDTKALAEKVEERNKIAMKLEGAETKLIKLANTARIKSSKGSHDEESAIQETTAGDESGSAAARWIKPKQRPTHRLKPIIGKKVDTINWSRSELQRMIPEIEAEQNSHRVGEAKPLNAVFVEFYNQTDAQAAYQMVAHHQPLHMSPRVIGFSPSEVVWKNLSITWRTRAIRNFLTISAVSLTIIFWSIPIAVVGAISHIDSLEKIAPFLKFINNIPPVILGVVTGLLPTIMLAVLMALLPPYLRFLGKIAGLPTLSMIELRLQTSYFWFQVIQVFLVTTMTSAASAAVPQIIKDPTSIPSLLASNLPLAANFYMSYFILQGLTFASGALLQIVGLILYKVLGKVLDSTPRKMYSRWTNLSALGWGTVFPVMTNLTVIAITYSAIAPLVLGFATIGMFLFYCAFRYNLLFVNTGNVDTKGLVYPRALQQTLVGCYLAMVCLIGLFAIKTGSDSGAAGPLVLMIIFLIVCILYHMSLNSAINPLMYYLPRSLEAEEESLMQAEEGAMSPRHDSEGTDKTDMVVSKELPPAPHKQPSMIQKFLRPDIYTDYATMRRLVPRDFGEIRYSEEVEREAYYDPAIVDKPKLLWVPRDQGGVSQQECAHTSKIIPMTDEGAFFNEKGSMVWDVEGTNGRPPVWEEKIYY